jgi:hypothetical protein
MRTLLIYALYLFISFWVLVWVWIVDLPLVEILIVNILFWCFIWALNVTYVVGIGNLIRRQKHKDEM